MSSESQENAHLYLVYVIRDKYAETFGMPMYMRSARELERAIRMAENPLFKAYPESYCVYYLGMYDSVTCKHSLAEAPTISMEITAIYPITPAVGDMIL